MAKAWIKEEVMEESGKDLVSTSKSTMKSNMENFAVWQANERANMWSGAPGPKTEGKHCTLDAKQAPDCKGSDHWWFKLASCSMFFHRMLQPKGLLQGPAKRAGRRHAIKFERHVTRFYFYEESWRKLEWKGPLVVILWLPLVSTFYSTNCVTTTVGCEKKTSWLLCGYDVKNS